MLINANNKILGELINSISDNLSKLDSVKNNITINPNSQNIKNILAEQLNKNPEEVSFDDVENYKLVLENLKNNQIQNHNQSLNTPNIDQNAKENKPTNDLEYAIKKVGDNLNIKRSSGKNSYTKKYQKKEYSMDF